MKKFSEGERVVLLANEEEGWKTETGTVIEVQEKDMYVVEIDCSFREDRLDDGIREVHVENMDFLDPTKRSN